MADPVVHWQIVAKDPDSEAKFYTALFGWSVSTHNALGYREVRTGGGIDGGIWPSPPEGHDLLQIFIEVDDLDASISKALSLGGAVIVPKSELPDGDAMAILLDPAGLSFGLRRRRR